MSKFSKALLPLVLVLSAAACSTGADRAGAQDLGLEIVSAPAPRAETPPPEKEAVNVSNRQEHFRPPSGGAIPTKVSRNVTPDDPLRVMVIGDSLADGFGIFMKQMVASRGLPVTVTNRGKTSTGLARTDFYNWPANFAPMAASGDPDVVVVHFGANDNQPIRLPGGGSVPYDTPEWDAAYRAEARKILDVAAANGAVVYWLGPAPDRDSHRNALLTKANRLFRAEAQAAGAHFISLPAFAAGPNGEFVRVAGGTTIRAGDGSHFTVAGYNMVVDRILTAIERDNPGIFMPPSVEVAGLQ
ncbi:DUF459 domain-containing protein [Psychromarinibacter sp. C21-152]|uniref:DUF459 domain-containing protein n=1 Tax=Psychromarinibacter sediminicola TaxID=3033385 RepID=A0AAE3NTI6_9RHOB|nr:DUF459 domain-containing protein [Psychromarinibacter sediminicola]MDF0603268.1 DUF459 domain-containing protein [Psychromarinibacter sediminicola]